jgi:hypothetical protein
MNILEHLFLVGEFPERARLLSGLTLEQVTLRPDGASHSIYEELWHAAGYQQSVLEYTMQRIEERPRLGWEREERDEAYYQGSLQRLERVFDSLLNTKGAQADRP